MKKTAKPTITEVAKRAKVSLSTASDILNGKLKAKPKTADRVRRAADTLGYKPNALARRLRTARTDAFGLIVPYRRSLFTSSLLTDFLTGIQSAQQRTGLNLVLASDPYEKKGDVYGADLFTSQTVDGLIVIGTRESFDRDLNKDVRALRKLQCPLVWLHYYNGTEAVDRIVRPEKDKWADIFTHLKNTNRKRVGFVLHPKSNGTIPSMEIKSIQKRTTNFGLDTKREWFGCGEVYNGSALEATLAVLQLPKSKRPEVLVCSSDGIAVVVLHAALGLGIKVPDDVALVSLENNSIGENAVVPITTWGAPANELGEAAVNRLCELIKDPGQIPKVIEIPGGLVERESTK